VEITHTHHQLRAADTSIHYTKTCLINAHTIPHIHQTHAPFNDALCHFPDLLILRSRLKQTQSCSFSKANLQ